MRAQGKAHACRFQGGSFGAGELADGATGAVSVSGEQAVHEAGKGHFIQLLNERLSHRLSRGHDVHFDWLYTIH